MDILRTFEVNGRLLKIASHGPITSAPPPVLEPPVIAPGTGKFEIGPLQLSAEKNHTRRIVVSHHTDKRSQYCFHLHREILFQDGDSGQFYGPVMQEYVLSGKNEKAQGVIYPNLGYGYQPND